MIVFY